MLNFRCCSGSACGVRITFYLAIQRSVWRDIKFAFFGFFCTVEDISTQDGAIGVKFWLRVEQTPGTRNGNEVVWGLAAPGRRKKRQMKFSLLWESMGNFCILADISATRARIHTKYYLCRDNVCRCAPSPCGVHRPLGARGGGFKNSKN